jgi:nucleotide-binding universal stress UspA family protein
MRSALWVPVILRGHPAGFLCLTSRRPGIFTPEHQAALGSISALVGLALEHERLWTLDVARRRRLEAIDQLLPTMAEGLEVRGLFDRISKVVQPILPHDRLILVSRSADGRVDTVDALSGDPATAIPSRIDLGPGDRPPTPEYELIRDFEDEADGPRRRVSRSEGIRSALSIRLWIDHTGSAQVDVRRLSSGGGDVGRLLLSQAAAFSADLVVMGAYGHSHLNAWMFGSVTRTVLREADLPVLMSR